MANTSLRHMPVLGNVHQIMPDMIGNMSMTAIFFRFVVDDFMRNSNFGIGVLHVKRKLLTYFATSFLCSLKFV